jgi:hypothetical protein
MARASLSAITADRRLHISVTRTSRVVEPPRDEVRRIAIKMAKLPDLVRRLSNRSSAISTTSLVHSIGNV